MSLNKAINATIALIEGRTDIAKEIFRDPTSDVKNIPEIMARLDRVVNKAAARAIRNGLKRTLAIQTGTPATSEDFEDDTAFYFGVSRVEELFEQIATELERE